MPRSNVWNGLSRGLGLSIVKAATEAMGGSISAASPGHLGATFMLEFPL